MGYSDNGSGFFTDLKEELSELRQAISDNWQSFAATLRNQMRMARGVYMDYVIIPVGGHLPERSAPPRSFIERQLPLPPPPFSMETLNYRLQMIADASNVKGVVFVFRGFNAGLATLQNFRRAVFRLRESGKEVIVFTPYLDVSHYYAATAADRIVIPPSAQFDVLGLRAEILFLNEALNRIGIEVDAIQISPHKTGPNMFSETDLTPQHREELNRMLDEWFDMITSEMANGRQKSQDELKALIDQAPHFAPDACSLGLVDHIAYEDELAFLLAATEEGDEEDSPSRHGDEIADQDQERDEPTDEKRPKAKLLSWGEAYSMLMEKPRRHSRTFIGVISLEGSIVMGPSRQSPLDLPVPFLGEITAGEQTIVRLLRRAEKIDELAALIFHVDSGGGSSLASDLIGREIKRLSQKKPVLVYMGNAAASGGYYVSAPARHIMSQAGTVTGSIGVFTLHFSTRGLYQTISVNRVTLERGDRAGLYSDLAPLTEEQRQVYREGVVEAYQQFKEMVAEGRDLVVAEIDPICEGRVWTGRQARDHKLVDSHGDFIDAVHKVSEMADLLLDDEHDVPVYNLYPSSDGHIPPKPFEAAELVSELRRLLQGEQWQQLARQPLMMMPFRIRLK